MRTAGLVVGCESRRHEPREWHHNENDIIMIIAGLVADGAGRRYGDWRHVAMGCNDLVLIRKSIAGCWSVQTFGQSSRSSQEYCMVKMLDGCPRSSYIVYFLHQFLNWWRKDIISYSCSCEVCNFYHFQFIIKRWGANDFSLTISVLMAVSQVISVSWFPLGSLLVPQQNLWG